METKYDAIVIGCGIFGVSSALELKKRGYNVVVIDRNRVPHEEASSTDISKIVRLDYGSDLLLTELMEECEEEWRNLNKRWGEQVYHEDGLLVISTNEMDKKGFEYESYQMLTKKGYELEKIKENIKQKFPAWNQNKRYEGYLNKKAGWAESGKAVSYMAKDALEQGVHFKVGAVSRILYKQDESVSGVELENGEIITSDKIVLSTGAWSTQLVPSLSHIMKPTAQVVFHFEIPKHLKKDFEHPNFTAYTSDIQKTGFYGFPAHPLDGRLKVGYHSVGETINPTKTNSLSYGNKVRKEKELLFRSFLKENLPSMADAPVIGYRVCYYCDTFDGNFFICEYPKHRGLILCTGGSGHGFKFGPMIGKLTSDVFEGKSNKYNHRFQYREPTKSFQHGDEARCLIEDNKKINSSL